MVLTKIEQETILNFNEDEPLANLYTYNPKLQKRFDQIAAEHPELVSRKAGSFGAVTYDFPKKLLIVSFQRPLSEAEQQRRSERAKQHKFAKKNP